MSRTCTYLAIALLFCQLCIAQDTTRVSVSDYVKIKVSAETLVAKNLRDLMNSVASSEFDKSEIEQIISNSCSGSYNRVFDSSNVIIEDDVDPAATAGNAVDKPVGKYLRDLDLLYTKSVHQSIVLTIAKISGLKRSGRYYLKVYYTSFFRNRNKTIDTPYTINNRVAEIFVRKENNRWTTAIARIGFFVPADTVNDVANDVALEMDNGQAYDLAAARKEQLSFEQELQEKEHKEEIERAQQVNDRYNQLISEGDKAVAIKDYQEALKKYSDAKQLKAYDKLVFAKLHEVQTKIEASKLDRDQLFDEYIIKAKAALKKREYKTAIEAYMAAKNTNSIKGAEYDQEINDLKIKYANVDKLDEMYKVGQYKDAISEYSSLIKKNKTYSDYYLGRGKCYDKLGESSRAMKDYTEAYNLEKDNLEALIQRADLNKRLNKYIDAIADYKSYLLSYKDNPVAYLQMADLRLLNNNPIEDAIGILDDGLKVPSLLKIPELYFKRGELKTRKSDWKNALADFTSTIKIDSTHKLALYDRGTCYLMMNQVSNAAADFENARSKQLDSLFINVIAGYAAQRFERAAAKFNQQAIDSAIILVNDAIAIDPYNDKYRFNKGEYYFSMQRYAEAIPCYDQAIQLNHNHATAWYKRGLSYHLQASYQKAIESFGRAMQVNPQYALAKKGIGDAQFALKDYESAAVAYEACLAIINASKLNDNNFTATVYNELGRAYYQLQQYEKSLAALKSAVKKNEMFAAAYFNRGLSYYQSGKIGDAIDDFNKALSLDNTPVPWKYYQARAYHNDNQFDVAISHYTELIRTDTAHLFPDALYLRGKSYYSLKQYQPALADYLAAYAQHQDTAVASFNYEAGNIYLNLGKYDSALAFFNKAYAGNATNGLASYGVASSLLLKGNKDEALVWFERSFATHQPGEKEIKRDPLIKGIANDKKFKDLLKKYY